MNKSGKINAREIYKIVLVKEDLRKSVALKKNNFFFMGWDLGKRFNLFLRIDMPTIKPCYHDKKKLDLIELYIEVIISYKMMYLSFKK